MPSNQPTNRARLRRFIAAESATLHATLRLYVSRAGVSGEQEVVRIADELLNEVTVEALEHAERFDPARSPMAWLLGIAANLIKRRQTAIFRRDQREPLIRDLLPNAADAMSDAELFDRFASFTVSDPAQAYEDEERVAALLSGVSESDRRVLRLAIVHGLNGETLARELGITPGAARVRLHRALNRLRAAYQEQMKVKHYD